MTELEVWELKRDLSELGLENEELKAKIDQIIDSNNSLTLENETLRKELSTRVQKESLKVAETDLVDRAVMEVLDLIDVKKDEEAAPSAGEKESRDGKRNEKIAAILSDLTSLVQSQLGSIDSLKSELPKLQIPPADVEAPSINQHASSTTSELPDLIDEFKIITESFKQHFPDSSVSYPVESMNEIGSVDMNDLAAEFANITGDFRRLVGRANETENTTALTLNDGTAKVSIPSTASQTLDSLATSTESLLAQIDGLKYLLSVETNRMMEQHIQDLAIEESNIRDSPQTSGVFSDLKDCDDDNPFSTESKNILLIPIPNQDSSQSKDITSTPPPTPTTPLLTFSQYQNISVLKSYDSSLKSQLKLYEAQIQDLQSQNETLQQALTECKLELGNLQLDHESYVTEAKTQKQADCQKIEKLEYENKTLKCCIDTVETINSKIFVENEKLENSLKLKESELDKLKKWCEKVEGKVRTLEIEKGKLAKCERDLERLKEMFETGSIGVWVVDEMRKQYQEQLETESSKSSPRPNHSNDPEPKSASIDCFDTVQSDTNEAATSVDQTGSADGISHPDPTLPLTSSHANSSSSEELILSLQSQVTLLNAEINSLTIYISQLLERIMDSKGGLDKVLSKEYVVNKQLPELPYTGYLHSAGHKAYSTESAGDNSGKDGEKKKQWGFTWKLGEKKLISLNFKIGNSNGIEK
ncbi:hypothetical protein BKA69DRAFT_1121936 [Paraphysoderma sedebokerense]|nr:hypothetical protein BKA69DRAFT_1121936 [Paraphysoderma sedebokerense]